MPSCLVSQTRKTTAPVDKGSPSNLPLDPAPLQYPAHRPVTADPSTSRDLSFGLCPRYAVRCPSDNEVPIPLHPDNDLFVNVNCKTENWLFLKPSFWTHSRTGFYSSISCDWQRFNRLRCRKSSWLPTLQTLGLDSSIGSPISIIITIKIIPSGLANFSFPSPPPSSTTSLD